MGATTSGSLRKRYIVFAGLVAIVAVLATFLLATLTRSTTLRDVVDARFDSPRVYRTGTGERQPRHIAMAIAPVINSRDSFQVWKDLSLYIGEKLSISIDLMQRRTYREVNDLLEGGEVEVALICSGPYVDLRRRGIVRLLVAPRIRGAAVYHSYIIVGTDSPIVFLDDLSGRSFAFSDPLSNSGKLYPTYLLHEKGKKPQTFFSRTIFTYGHDRSVRAVANGIVDGAAVDSTVFHDMVVREPGIGARVRIIHTSPPFGINPIVVRNGMSPDLVDGLRAAFLGMGEDDEGREILERLGIDSFQRSDPEAYKTIAEMQKALAE